VIALALVFARRLWAAALGGADARAPRLLAAVASTLIAGAIMLIGPPLRPPASSLPTGLAAVSRQRMPGLERPLAPLQQAEPLSAARWGLPGRRAGIFWRWAQGRYCSRRSSLGAKRQLRTEASYCAAASYLRPSNRTSSMYRRQRERATTGPQTGTVFAAIHSQRRWPAKGANWHPHSSLLTRARCAPPRRILGPALLRAFHCVPSYINVRAHLAGHGSISSSGAALPTETGADLLLGPTFSTPCQHNSFPGNRNQESG
jgi:hypothetical protein